MDTLIAVAAQASRIASLTAPVLASHPSRMLAPVLDVASRSGRLHGDHRPTLPFEGLSSETGLRPRSRTVRLPRNARRICRGICKNFAPVSSCHRSGVERIGAATREEDLVAHVRVPR